MFVARNYNAKASISLGVLTSEGDVSVALSPSLRGVEHGYAVIATLRGGAMKALAPAGRVLEACTGFQVFTRDGKYLVLGTAVGDDSAYIRLFNRYGKNIAAVFEAGDVDSFTFSSSFLESIINGLLVASGNFPRESQWGRKSFSSKTSDGLDPCMPKLGTQSTQAGTMQVNGDMKNITIDITTREGKVMALKALKKHTRTAYSVSDDLSMVVCAQQNAAGDHFRSKLSVYTFGDGEYLHTATVWLPVDHDGVMGHTEMCDRVGHMLRGG